MSSHSKRILVIFCLAGITLGLLYGYSAYTYGTKNALIIATALISLLASLFIMHFAVNIYRWHHLTIPSFFYISYLLMIFFPSFAVAFRKPIQYRFSYHLSVSSVLLTIPLGIIAASLIWGFRKKEISAFYTAPVDKGGSKLARQLVFAGMTIGAVTLVILYILEVKTIPLIQALKNPGNYAQIVQLRESAFKLLDSPLIYPYAWLRNMIFPTLIMMALGYYLVHRRKQWLAIFLFCLCLGVAYNGFAMAKMPVAAIFLMLILFIFVYRAGRIKKRNILIGASLLLGIPVISLIFLYYGSSFGILNSIRFILRRIFQVPAQALYYYFEVFPEHVGFLQGRSIARLADIMGWEFFNTANYVFKYIFPHGVETGLTNAAFIGNLHADFGISGVVLGGVVAGFLMQSIQIMFLRNKKTVANLALYAYMLFAFWLLNSTALPGIFLTYGVLIAIILFWLIRFSEDIIAGVTSKIEETPREND